LIYESDTAAVCFGVILLERYRSKGVDIRRPRAECFVVTNIRKPRSRYIRVKVSRAAHGNPFLLQASQFSFPRRQQRYDRSPGKFDCSVQINVAAQAPHEKASRRLEQPLKARSGKATPSAADRQSIARKFEAALSSNQLTSLAKLARSSGVTTAFLKYWFGKGQSAF
jgi:hypothetical protein